MQSKTLLSKHKAERKGNDWTQGLRPIKIYTDDNIQISKRFLLPVVSRDASVGNGKKVVRLHVIIQ